MRPATAQSATSNIIRRSAQDVTEEGIFTMSVGAKTPAHIVVVMDTPTADAPTHIVFAETDNTVRYGKTNTPHVRFKARTTILLMQTTLTQLLMTAPIGSIS